MECHKPCGRGKTIDPNDICGRRFGRLFVESYAEMRKKTRYYNCVCDCGEVRQVARSNLTTGQVVSCGCYRRDRLTTHNGKGSSTYWVWAAMIQRCSNPKCKGFRLYGARGIDVCKRWESYENFVADMGERPRGMSIDRIDNERGYSPENCRWATLTEQANNTRRNHWIVFDGEEYTLSQASRKFGIAPGVLRYRLVRLEWPIRQALGLEPRVRGDKAMNEVYGAWLGDAWAMAEAMRVMEEWLG